MATKKNSIDTTKPPILESRFRVFELTEKSIKDRWSGQLNSVHVLCEWFEGEEFKTHEQAKSVAEDAIAADFPCSAKCEFVILESFKIRTK